MKSKQNEQVCTGPLENVSTWGEFTDFVKNFQLYRGTGTEEENEKVGELKVSSCFVHYTVFVSKLYSY